MILPMAMIVIPSIRVPRRPSLSPMKMAIKAATKHPMFHVATTIPGDYQRPWMRTQ